jgi:cell wall assembly regulator SMI1
VDWTALLATDDGFRLQNGVTDEELQDAEANLGCHLPEKLARLYRLTNGVWDNPGQWYVIWPMVDVIQRNREAGQIETLARQQWIAFGDDGTGNPFCVHRRGGGAVYYWNLIDQQATLLADDLPSFWTAWVADTLPPH